MSSALAIIEGNFGRACLIEKDRRVGLHAHTEPHVVLMIGGEAFAYQVGESIAPCTREHMVLVNALELHQNHSIADSHSVILSLYLSPRWTAANRVGGLARGQLFDQPSAPMPVRLRALADRLADQMQQAVVSDTAALTELVAEIALLTLGQSIPGRHEVRFGRLNDIRIRRAVGLMHESVCEQVELARIASQVGLSRSRFFDLFSLCTGLSPKHYLDMLRMEVATSALARPGQTIAEISEACGYGAQSHFSRFFTHRIGITPSEYRRAAGMIADPA